LSTTGASLGSFGLIRPKDLPDGTTGPFIVSEVTPSFAKSVHRYRQPRPWLEPLPFIRNASAGEGEGAGYWGRLAAASRLSGINLDAEHIIAYDRLHQKLGNKANVALSAIDSGKSLLMIKNRVSSLFGAIRELKRGNIAGVARRLLGDQSRLSPSRIREIRKISTKDPASAWLEFTFGWVPLYQDIFAAISVLEQDFGFHSVKVSVKKPANRVYATVYWDQPGGPISQSDSWTESGLVAAGGSIRITNPNLLLARQLGLVNPAFVAWDAVPFSFVVDWFLPVGKFLDSFSNELGVELFRTYVTEKRVLAGYNQLRSSSPSDPPEWKNGGQAFSVVRERRVLARPTLFQRARTPGISPWLLGTSVALLRQNVSTLKGFVRS